MNKGIVKLISALALMTVLTGCGGMALQGAENSGDRPILSAAEAQAQIRVTVRTLEPAVEQETIVAAND